MRKVCPNCLKIREVSNHEEAVYCGLCHFHFWVDEARDPTEEDELRAEKDYERHQRRDQTRDE